jgi:hypothetical protein
MKTWKSLLHADPTDWLLEPTNPSVRYITLKEILEKPETHSEVIQAKQEIMRTGVVPAILENQHEKGYWEAPERFYSAKYKGTVWQLIILAEHFADVTDYRIRNACEFILANSQDAESGGFAYNQCRSKGGGRHTEVIPCLTGNMVFSLIRLGYLNDPRLQHAIGWITIYQRFDDRIRAVPTGWPYDRLKTGCFSRHSCHMGAAKALKALAEIPEKKRNTAVKKTIEKGAEYFLIHHVFRSSHHLEKIPKPGWLRYGFPLMYQTDALEILGFLTKLDYHDERMQEAIDILISKQNTNGRWSLENTFNGRYQVHIEKKDTHSKWITLRAIQVLKKYYSKSTEKHTK